MSLNNATPKSYKPHFIIALFLLITVATAQFFYYKKAIDQKQDLLQLVQTNLEQSNNTIRHFNENTIFGFQQKMKKPELVDKAERWYPRITETQRIVATTQYLLMESEKAKYLDKAERLQLLDSLQWAVAKMIDTIPEAMRSRLPKLPLKTLFDKTDDGNENPFNKKMVLAANDEDWKFMLLKLNNDLLSSGSIIIQFCDDHVAYYTDGYDKSEVLISQNSKVLVPGQTLEIKAGIGVFSEAMKPEIFIDGVSIPRNDLGYVKYKKVIMANDPGKVNLKLKYKDQNGMEVTQQQTVTYKVLKP